LLRTVASRIRLFWWFMVWWSFRGGERWVNNSGMLDAALATCWARVRRKATSAWAADEL
jgi:hypothetical protein